jgi:hypothetical protein
MFKRIVIGALFAGGTLAVTAGFADSRSGTSSRFDSATDLAAVIDNIRPNTIVLAKSDPAGTPAHVRPYEDTSLGGAHVREAWQQARRMIARVSRAVHDGSAGATPAFAASPCVQWEERSDEDGTQQARTGCRR